MKISRICCIGAGYVGGPTMAVIAHECPDIVVQVVDDDKKKIEAWNSKNLNELPIYEPGLSEIVKKTRGKNLFFSEDTDKAICESQMIFLAVNTPTKTKGEGKGFAADLSNVEKCAKRIAKLSKSKKIIVEKSTLPVKTAEKIKTVLTSNNRKIKFEVISNPEFLAEGTAIENLYKSDRVLIGGEDSVSGRNAVKLLVNIYKRWIPQRKILKTNVWSSELSKLASNAMLAQRISSINSLSALCEKTGASISELSKAIGADKRIGNKFLNSSVGFGGSCFQKDILNLVYLCKVYGLNEVAEFWHQIVKINDFQKKRFTKRVLDAFDNKISGISISVLGWAYKKNTNDSRESASIYISSDLLEKGAVLNIYDPMVKKERIMMDLKMVLEKRNINNKQVNKLLDNVHCTNRLNESFLNTKGIAIMTEWDEFKAINWNKILTNQKQYPIVFDGRNIIQNKSNHKLYTIGE
tara:strand:+ start:1751 stop:3148 length:1398 start_codon:yes stop_codon:yes gene_type:complete